MSTKLRVEKLEIRVGIRRIPGQKPSVREWFATLAGIPVSEIDPSIHTLSDLFKAENLERDGDAKP